MPHSKSKLICVPVCERRLAGIARGVARAAEAADILELRLDYLDEEDLGRALSNLTNVRAALRESGLPAILTLRAVDEGGRQGGLERATRYAFWSSNIHTAYSDFVDIEFDLLRELVKGEPKGNVDWNRVICSYHDFSGVPADIERTYELMNEMPARIVKIAVQANDATDCIPVFQLLTRAREENRELIAIAMGESGLVTRILGPSRGSFLTYGAIDSEHATAPGQVTARALRDLYRFDSIDRETAVTGLIGFPVAHSISPHMHNLAFAACDLNAVYIPFEVRDIAGFIRRMAHPRTREIEWNLRLLSVTAPHKTTVIENLDWIEPGAKEIGAVNTIVVDGDALRGYNTDAAAALAPIEKLIDLAGARIAVIGAGGAARSLLWGLQQAGAQATIFARHAGRAEPLAAQFGASLAPLDGARFRDFAVVINATPLGTRGPGEDRTPATRDQLEGAELAYDLVYNPLETRFMREAQKAGCTTLGGLEMLVNQAAAQFKLWTHRDAPLDVMRQGAEEGLRTGVGSWGLGVGEEGRKEEVGNQGGKKGVGG